MHLTFDRDSHTYTLDGRVVPSVTQVLEPLQQLEGIPQELLEYKSELGRHGHAAAHLMVQNTLEWRSLDPRLTGYLQGAQKFLKDTGFRVLRSEYSMADPDLKVAGTADVFGVMEKDRFTWLLDWKFAATVSRTWGPQTAAYDHLVRRTFGGRPNKRGVVQLFPEGGYKLHVCSDKRDFQWFVSALNVWGFLHDR